MARRIVGIVVAVALAALGTAVLVAYVRTAETRALAGERVVDVLVVESAVETGTPAEALGGSVRSEQVPAKVQAVGSVEDLSELQGLVTTVALVPGEQVVRQRFAEPAQLGQIPVPDGLLQVTVSLEPQRALGGRVAPGDRVGLVASFGGGAAGGEEEEGRPAEGPTSHLILHKVLVTAVQGTGQPPPNGEGAPAPPTSNLLVTLAVDAPSVERIVFAAEHGSVWLGLEPEDAPEDGTRIQTRGSIYR